MNERKVPDTKIKTCASEICVYAISMTLTCCLGSVNPEKQKITRSGILCIYERVFFLEIQLYTSLYLD